MLVRTRPQQRGLVSACGKWFLGWLLICLMAGCESREAETSPKIRQSKIPTDTSAVAAPPHCGESLAAGSWALGPESPAARFGAGASTGLVLCGRAIERAQLLRELARSEAFAISGEQQIIGEFSGWVRGDNVAEVLAALLTSVNFTTRFVAVPSGHKLSELHIADAAWSESPEDAPAFPSNTQTAGLSGQLDAELQARWQADYGDLQEQLTDTDPGVRLATLEEFVAQGPGLDVLDQLLVDEPDPQIRIALLEKLDESGSVVALQTMLRHLQDPDPDVVFTTIELVVDWHDEELVLRHVRPLVNHASSVVRAAAEEAVDRFR